MLVTARAAAPSGMVIKSLFEQSVFVTSSVIAVLREGAIAAGLTAMMILLFLGSWRPTIVVMVSIPLAMLTSLVVLYFLGETINTMTLGGLALAVGILVDDSTVTIENTYRLLDEEKMPLPKATPMVRRMCSSIASGSRSGCNASPRHRVKRRGPHTVSTQCVSS